MTVAQQPRVAYVSSYAYASGPANDTRARGVIEALRALGCEVDVMPEPGGLSQRMRRLARTGPIGRPLRLVGMAGAVPEWLDSRDSPPDLVWLYGLDIRFSARVLRWARRRGVPVVCEVVDWYQLRDLPGAAPRLVLALTNALAMPWARRSAAGFVVASRALGDYFGSRSAVTRRIPAVIPALPASSTSLPTGGGPLVVGYVGSPGRRDGATLANLRTVVRDWEGPPLSVHVAGAEPPSSPWETSSSVDVHQHGRIPRDEAVALVASCHATVLQRPEDRRFARAGFPSKVAESMACGAVPITNVTGDLGLVLRDGIDSILLADPSAEALRRGLTQLTTSTLERDEVRESAHALFSVAAAERQIRTLFSAMGIR